MTTPAAMSLDQEAAVIPMSYGRGTALRRMPRPPDSRYSCCGCAAASMGPSGGCLILHAFGRSYCGDSRADKRKVHWKEVPHA